MLKVFGFLCGIGAVAIGILGYLSYQGYGILMKANPGASAIQITQIGTMSIVETNTFTVGLLAILVVLKACEIIFAQEKEENKDADKGIPETTE